MKDHFDNQQDRQDLDTFPVDVTGLPEADRSAIVDVSPGGSFDLSIHPVAKRIDDGTFRMLSYNGSIPGPTLRVRQGSETVVNVTNETNMDTTVHWHGFGSRIATTVRTRLRHPYHREIGTRTASRLPTRACSGTTPTCGRTTRRRWASTRTSSSSQQIPRFGLRQIATSS